MTIEIKEKLTGSILDIGGGGEAVIGQIYKDRVTAIDNCKEELEEAPDCCSKQLMDATELSFPDDSFDNVTFFYTLMYMTAEEQQKSICEAARVLRVGKQMYIWDCDIRSAYPEPFMIALDIGAATTNSIRPMGSSRRIHSLRILSSDFWKALASKLNPYRQKTGSSIFSAEKTKRR